MSPTQNVEIPDLEIPVSPNTVTVRVIDTTTRISFPMGTMFDPLIKGHSKFSSPSYSFLVENERLGRKVLFDLGTQRKWEEQAPSIVKMIKEYKWDVQVEKDVAEILEENEVKLDTVEAIIWSHWHWDHLGDPSTFPGSTDLIVGPGFTKRFIPDGQPIPNSPVKKEYYENRNLREISTEEFKFKIGGFPAFDLFEDGSFYLIDSPGHTVGHMCALARTTINPDTFIFMGGDIAHHAGEFRPTKYVPLPSLILPNPLNFSSAVPCPGHVFETIHHQKSGNSPFYRLGTWPNGDSAAEDLPAAIESLEKLQLVDAHLGRVFVIIAHDENIRNLIDFFPKPANEWKRLGWGDNAHWMFLGDFKEAIVE